jgi:lysophospholipase L1-like esterase
LEILGLGENGQTIDDLRIRMESAVIANKPDAVIMLWDSDVNVNEGKMTTEEVKKLREGYLANMDIVLGRISSTTKYFAIAGPTVLGEGFQVGMPGTDRFSNKVPMLSEYIEYNKQMAAKYDASYINVYQAFVDYIPSCQLFYKWCVTIDGEHPNERGAVIIARVFAEMISKWLIEDIKSRVK